MLMGVVWVELVSISIFTMLKIATNADMNNTQHVYTPCERACLQR